MQIKWTSLRARASKLLQQTAHSISALQRGLRRARPVRRLRLRETLLLGDRRFLAVVECDGREMIIGGSTHNLTLLTHLPLESPGGATSQALAGARCFE